MPEISRASRSLGSVDDLLAPEDEWRRARESRDDASGSAGPSGSTEPGAPAAPSDPGPKKPAPKGRNGAMEGFTNILIGGVLILLGAFLAWADLTSEPTRGALRPLALVAALLLVSHGVLMLITATEEKKHDSGARERSGMLMLVLGLVLALATLGHSPKAELTLLSYASAFVLFGTGYILLVRRPVAR